MLGLPGPVYLATHYWQQYAFQYSNRLLFSMTFAMQTLRGRYNRGQARNSLIEPRNETEQQLQEIQRKLTIYGDEVEQLGLIGRAVKLMYGFEANPGQVECISWMPRRDQGLILVAKTSFGKSLVMQVLPCLVPRSIVIIVLPLLALGSEQEEKRFDLWGR